jgi:putative MATE family efflux protein
MGGSGAVLAAALSYSNIVFAGAVPLWIVSLLSASLRGSGDAKTPALVIFGGIMILIPLSPALIFGWGPFPRLGIAGAGTAVVTYYILAAITLIAYMRSSRSPLKLSPVRLEGRLFKQILGVGLLSAVGTLQTNLTVTCVTGIVGLFGSDAIAGYGIASRLDYLQVPILFGFGTAVVTMVGVNVGAGQIARARRIAWTAAGIAAAFTGLLGLVVLIFPHAWIGLFSNDPKVLASGTLYLQAAAPVYGAVGLGMLLYFASQGASRVLWPVLAGSVRMLVAVLIGWYCVVKLGASLSTLFHFVALASLLYGAITAIWMLADSWGARRSIASVPEPAPAE